MLSMAPHKLLSLAAFISVVSLAAASRSPAASVQDLVVPLQGSASLGVSFDCTYTFYVETGWIWKAGTDAKIGLTLYGADGNGFTVRDLAGWAGIMGAGYDYFERGNVDVFIGRAPCLSSRPCTLKLFSDGSGDHHGWYCRSVEVTVARQHHTCARSVFSVEQWLARDAPPFQLYAERSVCTKVDAAAAAE